uniref:Uncharacterized protein n=1 Tax=Phaeocystis cordata TaxID=118079 RepID=A0A7S1HQ10_9EUKA|mmetsp:Transcript_1567/g.3561  ORF Transcript_1567/g.3561 Transcript_1567/m.3561 type:complete len:122 (+) Transcript_1567:128-493(+)
MTSVEKALICAVLLALPAAISCAPLQQQQREVRLAAPLAGVLAAPPVLSGRRLRQSPPGYDEVARDPAGPYDLSLSSVYLPPPDVGDLGEEPLEEELMEPEALFNFLDWFVLLGQLLSTSK